MAFILLLVSANSSRCIFRHERFSKDALYLLYSTYHFCANMFKIKIKPVKLKEPIVLFPLNLTERTNPCMTHGIRTCLYHLNSYKWRSKSVELHINYGYLDGIGPILIILRGIARNLQAGNCRVTVVMNWESGTPQVHLREQAT